MRRATVGIVLAFVVGAASAAYTGALGAFQSDLAASSAALSGLTDPVSVQRKKAVDRALAAVLAYSPSLAKDLGTSVKVAHLLEKPFPPEDPLLAAFDGALDGLAAEVAVVRGLLAEEDSLLSGAKKAAADSALASVDASLVLADLSATRAGRAALLKKAEKRATGARKSLRKGAPGGFQGPVNGSFEAAGATSQEAAFWNRSGTHPRFGGPSVNRYTTGTATNGVADEYIDGENWALGTLNHVATLSQQEVLLSKSKRLLFDYSAAVNVAVCNSGPDLGAKGTGRLEVLFSLDSPATTVVLWTREFPAGATAETVAGQAIDLPFLPSAGTLTFRVTTIYVYCGGDPPAQGLGLYSDVNIRIDNVRVE